MDAAASATSDPAALPESRPAGHFGLIDFLRAQSDPNRRVRELHRQYGDTFELTSIFGPTVFSCDPEVARAFFTADPDTFTPFNPDQISPFLGETSLTLVTGARHRRDRKLLSPPFHGDRMRAYGSIMAACARRAAAEWVPGKPFKMLDATQRISLDVILRAVFGLEQDAARSRAIHDAVVSFIGAMSVWITFFFTFRRRFFGVGPWARFMRAREHLDELLLAEIADRRRAPTSGEDILSLMMSARHDDGSSMSDNELRDELLTLLFAGHETTAVALSWAFYWIHRDPEELARVQDEIDSLGSSPEPDAIAALPYLEAVCHEALRIYPVVTEVPRVVARPFVLSDRVISPGKTFFLAIGAIHWRPELYPDADRFRPSRFLERKFSPFEFLPFGGGPRRCIGAAFALYEMKIVLATILRSHRMHLVSPAPVTPRRRGFTMGPPGGIPMVYDGPRDV